LLKSQEPERRSLLKSLLRMLPRGLYARALIIIIAPIVLLQSIVAFVFMERHWERVTQRLSAATVQDIAAVIDVIETYPHSDDYEELARIAQQRLNLSISVLPLEPLPSPAPKRFFSILDGALSDEMRSQIGRPFWVDTVGNSNLIEVRVQLEDAVLRVFARRSHTYASNSHIFLVWMVGSSLVLMAIAIVFLRNQITPILRLSEEMEAFGRGRGISPDFRARGAREVRQASRRFLIMGQRLERQMEQRTTMLAGVSHDLRTVLTRFKLELAVLPKDIDVSGLEADVDQMQQMLQGYLDFVSGHADEPADTLDVVQVLEAYHQEARLKNCDLEIESPDELPAVLLPSGFKRLMDNLVANAFRHGTRVRLSATMQPGELVIHIDDNGTGIPEEKRGDVFRPFFRLDSARNIDESGTGLGLSIAQDIALAHGGDIELGDSDLGGLRASVFLPQ
jgi:two-component system osmolarity sensor histidine kinase EnvZ